MLNVFAGWNTASDGSGTAYADGASVTNLTTMVGATITLYAQWKTPINAEYVDADITVTRMAGGSYHDFTGTFDGDGGLQRGETLYYGSDDQLSLTLNNTAASVPSPGMKKFNAIGATASQTETLGQYTLTMPANDVTVSLEDVTPTITLADMDLTYTGTAIEPEVTVKDGETTLTANADYTVAYSSNTNAGEATVTITGCGVYLGTATKTFTIARADINPTLVIQDKTYNGQKITYTIDNNPGGGSVTSISWEKENSNGTWSSFDDTPKDAGKYRGTASIAETDNYKGANTKTAEFTISKATPVVGDFVFSAPAELSYDGLAKVAALSLVDTKTGAGDITMHYFKGGNEVQAPVAAGTYTVKIDVAGGDNFVAATALTGDTWTFTITAPADGADIAVALTDCESTGGGFVDGSESIAPGSAL